jgi:hypothetical protein
MNKTDRISVRPTTIYRVVLFIAYLLSPSFELKIEVGLYAVFMLGLMLSYYLDDHYS